jgi:hypothetical protein
MRNKPLFPVRNKKLFPDKEQATINQSGTAKPLSSLNERGFFY